MPATRTSFAICFLTTVTIAAVIYYGLSQPPISSEGGRPYDAQEYYTMAVQVAAGEPVSVLRPFAYRIALPFLAGVLFPDNIAFGFWSLNLFFSLVTLGVFYLFGCVLVALFTGFHTDRIVFRSFPAVLLLFGVFFERHLIAKAATRFKLAFFAPLIAAQILAWRAWLPIPDDTRAELFDPGAPQLVLLSACGNATLGHVYAATLPAASRLALLAQYLALMLYFGLVLRLAGGRESRDA